MPPVGWPVVGYTRVYYAGDTVVGGLPGQRLAEQHAEQAWGSQDIYSYQHPTAMITRASNGVVHVWSMELETWDTLYWFGAAPGDGWQRAHDVPFVGNPSDWIEVTDTTTVVIDGVPLRQLTVEQVCDGTYINWGGTITDRLGYYTPFYFPESCTTESGIWELRCYSDNEIDFAYGSPCDFLLSIASSADPDIGVFPNPGTDHFSISLAQGPHIITLFDALGQQVVQQRSGSGQFVVDTRSLPSGIYTVQFNEGGRPLRWVKE